MWQHNSHQTLNLHTHFELLRGVPTRMDLTGGNASERDVLKASLQADRVYVMDCGYSEFVLFNQIIETFFRFFKHVLGCQHLNSHAVNGIEIQAYLGIIACLPVALWRGRKPTLRTYEMICHYFSGLADEEELPAHIETLTSQA